MFVETSDMTMRKRPRPVKDGLAQPQMIVSVPQLSSSSRTVPAHRAEHWQPDQRCDAFSRQSSTGFIRQDVRFAKPKKPP
jgi:hypothetical protein